MTKHSYLFFIYFFSLVFILFISHEKAFAEEEEYDFERSRINVQKAWDAGLTGKGVKIAIIDTGIKADHPDLEGNIAGGVSCVGYRTISYSEHEYSCYDPGDTVPWYKDEVGHGTHIAGIIAAKHNGKGIKGIAPGAEVYSVRVSEDKRSIMSEPLIAGINWAIDNDMDIINISIGSKYDSAETLFEKEGEYKAIKKAHDKGILIVTGAGNDGESSGKDTSEYPGKFNETISVGGFYNGDVRCWADGLKDYIDQCNASGSSIDIAAPSRIYSTTNEGDYSHKDGTSFSAPMVVGTAALYLEQMKKEYGETYTDAQIRHLLLEKADYIEGMKDENGHNIEFGAGAVQATPIEVENSYFKTWLDEMKRKSSTSKYYKNLDEITSLESFENKPWTSHYDNKVMGYEFDYPTYWFVDHVEPSKYVRFFFHDFKVEVNFQSLKTEEKRIDYLNDMLTHLPPGGESDLLYDADGNAITKYKFGEGVYFVKNDLDQNIYYFVNTPNGIFTFKVKTNEENLSKKTVNTIEEEMERLLKTFKNYDTPLDDVISSTKQDEYSFRITNDTNSSWNTKNVFGIYDNTSLDRNFSNVERAETELNATFGSQTIGATLDYSGTGEEFTDQIKEIANKGKIPIVDLSLGRYRYSSSDILQGWCDDNIKSWANNLKEIDHPVYIRLGKDMNGSMKQQSVFQREYYGDIYYSVEPDIYKLAYRHVVDLMKKEGANNIKFVWSPSVESIPNISFNDLTRYYPGDEYVDWINLSGYNIDGEGEVDPVLWHQMIKAKTRTFDEVFGDVYNELRRMYPDKPMMIETSSLNRDNSKETYIHSLFDHLSDYPNIQITTWYHGTNIFLWDDLSYDYGKNEFNITLPRTTDEYVSSMLNDTSKFVTNPY